MKHVMLIGVLFFTSLALGNLEEGASFDSAGTPRVLRNRLAMTVASILVQPTNENYKTARVPYLNRPVPLLEKHKDLRITYRLQANKNAPLAFVLPGIGGLFTSSSALYTAEVLHSEGYHTVTMDNPFSWAFTISGGRKGLPGITVEDSKDAYAAMLQISNFLKKQEGLRPRSFALAGLSLGGLQAMFIKEIDNREGHFKFSPVLAANPPMDVRYAVSQLDDMMVRGSRLSEDRKVWVYGKAMEVGQDLLANKRKVDENELQRIFDRLGFDDDDLSYLIGYSFRLGLRDTIFASQQVHDLGILKTKATEYKRNERMNEAARFSFKDYLRTFVFPQARKNRDASYDVDRLNSDSSLYQFADLIKGNDKVYIFHSGDDFLLKNGDREWIQTNFGAQRALISPYGGHMGALGFSQYTEYLKRIF